MPRGVDGGHQTVPQTSGPGRSGQPQDCLLSTFGSPCRVPASDCREGPNHCQGQDGDCHFYPCVCLAGSAEAVSQHRERLETLNLLYGSWSHPGDESQDTSSLAQQVAEEFIKSPFSNGDGIVNQTHRSEQMLLRSILSPFSQKPCALFTEPFTMGVKTAFHHGGESTMCVKRPLFKRNLIILDVPSTLSPVPLPPFHLCPFHHFHLCHFTTFPVPCKPFPDRISRPS